MKTLSANFLRSFLFLLSFVALNDLRSQCSISVSGQPCIGSPLQFGCNSQGFSSISWDFNGEGSNTSSCNPVFTFTSTGIKKITLTVQLANGSQCTTTYNLLIKSAPIASLRMTNGNKVQCYQGNEFCFKDSSYIAGDSICKREIVFDDGIKYTSTDNRPFEFCHSFQDTEGGNYGCVITITSCNGCVISNRYNNIASVLPSMGLSFSSLQPKRCDSVYLVVNNTSAIPLDSISSFEWNWGDGQYTFGNKNTPALWKIQVPHWYKTQGPNDGHFDVILKVINLRGCTETFTFKNAAKNIIVNPIIISSKDSVCSDNAVINFSLKDGPIIDAANPLYVFENPPIPTNIARQWTASHTFNNPGPYRISFSFTHQIPGCGRTTYDTIIVIGPKSVIESSVTDMDFLERGFQCVIKDTVDFSNFSKYYHNDSKMTDDDSTYVDLNGFNAPIGHKFNSSNNTSLNSLLQQRLPEHIIPIWDFDDDYCENCTTDTKNNINVDVNCRYSKDFNPKHLYTDWEDIYNGQYMHRALNINAYDRDSGYVRKLSLWADDSAYIVRDTFLYYGDNGIANKSIDSSVYANVGNRVKIASHIQGPSTKDIFRFERFHIPSGTSVWINKNDGSPPFKHTGPKNINVLAGQSISMANSSDKLYYLTWLEYSQDTITKSSIKGSHKPWKIIGMNGFKTGDSVDANYHRRRFYESSIVSCKEVKLFQKDIRHPLACTSETSIKLSLAPPSARYLRKSGIQCFGNDNNGFGITFILDETKPGCSNTWTAINFDTAKDKNAWVPAIGKNMSSGQISMGELPPIYPPFLTFPNMPLPGNKFSKLFSMDDIADKKSGYIDVGLIVGNGIHAGGNYPDECVDTAYYPKFAKFPIIDNSFRIISGRVVSDANYYCKNETIVLKLSDTNRTNIEDVGTVEWSIISSNTGKYHNNSYKLSVKESYDRFTVFHKDSSFLMDYLTIEKWRTLDTIQKLLSKVKIPIARVNKWHTEADITLVYENVKTQLTNAGLNITDFNSTQIHEMIWNGIGVIGKAHTGSRGLIDTSGIGNKIIFTNISDKKISLHKRDTVLTPLDINLGNDNNNHASYGFKPEFYGFYLSSLNITSKLPNQCPSTTNVLKAIVGFFGEMNIYDSVLCHGQKFVCSPQFRYFEMFPEIQFRTEDPVDYWRNRIQEAGNPNREGYTRTDLNKADDGTHPRSIFGGYPYSITGLDNAPNKVLELSHSNPSISLYYHKDTGMMYIIRMATSDSMGCRDTLVQNLYTTAARAKIKLDFARPQCHAVITAIDSSYIQDPIKDITGMPSDSIIKWVIDWGDKGQGNQTILFNKFKPEINHMYQSNGFYTIRLTVYTALGCVSSDSTVLYISGPIPLFDTLIPSKVCTNQMVKFDNLSQYRQLDSCIWIWEYGDGGFGSQFDKLDVNNNPISHAYKEEGMYDVKLHLYYKLNSGSQMRTCLLTYPNSDLGQKTFTMSVIKCDSSDIDGIGTTSRFKMYPNPAVNSVTFKSDDPVSIDIYNSLGQLVLKFDLTDEKTVDLRHLSKGIYLVKIEGRNYTEKLILE